MDEYRPDNEGKKNEEISGDLAILLRELIELELAKLRAEQEKSMLECEEMMLHDEQYCEDSSDAYYSYSFEEDNC